MVLEEEFINLSPESSFIGDISINPLMLTNMLLNSNLYISKEFVNNLADLYIKWGRSFDIRSDFAWSQMCLETNFLKFTNIAKLEWNNFCNLGVIKKKGLKGGYDYLTFETPELGVIAHYAHLAWYLFPEHVNEYCSLEYDPRHMKIDKKEHLNVGYKINCLDMKWKPDKNYSKKISRYVNVIYSLIAEGRNWEKRKNILEIIKNGFIDLANIRKSEKKWEYIAIHHSATLDGNVKAFRRHHVNVRGFRDIGYNFVICNGNGGNDGKVQIGRSLEMGGAHVKGYNKKAIGVNLVGWFDDIIYNYKNKKWINNIDYKKPSEKQMKSLTDLVRDLKIEYNIPIKNIMGHREFPNVRKSCPGYNFDMDYFREIFR